VGESENERKCEKKIKGLTDEVARLQKGRAFPKTYEDLKDLPVILIVCLKGTRSPNRCGTMT